MDNDPIQPIGNSINQQKRDQFIRARTNIKEKEFWRLFFLEIDKRHFVAATFQSAEFGVHVHNRRHLSSSGGKYSLMYTRSGSFLMNDTPYGGKTWSALERLRNWCTTDGLPEQFYSELRARKLLTSPDYMDLSKLLQERTPQEVLGDLLVCIDLFR